MNQIRVKLVKSPKGNAESKVRIIRLLIDKYKVNPRIKKLAVNLVKDDRFFNFYQNVKILSDFVKNNIKFIFDTYNLEYFQSPFITLYVKGGDCDDLVILLGTLLESIGYPVNLTVLHKGNKFFHIYLKVGFPPVNPVKWIDVDVSSPMIKLGDNVLDKIKNGGTKYAGILE